MHESGENEVAQSYPTLSDPMDCSLPGSSIHGIFQARVLEWGAIAFSKKCSNYHTIALISHTSKVMSLLFNILSRFVIGEGNGTPLQYFAWKIPWMEEPGRLQSMGSRRVGHD